MPRGKSYSDVLSAALDDMIEHGYDSAERLAYWQRKIREAAEASLASPRRMEEMLRDVLRATYDRMLKSGRIAEYHKGINRFTLQRVDPLLRDELTRRIMASVDLIRLNRTRAVEQTLQRFSGWGSSIPSGGTKQADRRAEKSKLRKPLARLRFEERRVLTDQGHKLVAAINDVVATGGGAIAARWRSKWRQPGYDYREDHKERDEVVYGIKGSWAFEQGLLKKPPTGWTDEITAPAEEPYCFPGDSKIPFADGVEVAYRRRYSGELVVLVTSSGKTLRATPNHPVLTTNGWKAVGSLNVGDDIVEVADHLIDALEDDENDAVPTLSEIFGALQEDGVARTTRDGVANFHGDGSDGDVDIVLAAGRLLIDHVTPHSERLSEIIFAETFVALLGPRAIYHLPHRLFLSTKAFVRSFGEALSPRYTFAHHSDFSGNGSISDFDACPKKPFGDYWTRYVKTFRKRKDTRSLQVDFGQRGIVENYPIFFSSLVAKFKTFFAKAAVKCSPVESDNLPDLLHVFPFATQTANVVKIERAAWTGHVYNLQVRDEWYAANGIITHNCGCRYVYIYNLRDVPEEWLTAKGREKLAEVRRKIAEMA